MGEDPSRRDADKSRPSFGPQLPAGVRLAKEAVERSEVVDPMYARVNENHIPSAQHHAWQSRLRGIENLPFAAGGGLAVAPAIPVTPAAQLRVPSAEMRASPEVFKASLLVGGVALVAGVLTLALEQPVPAVALAAIGIGCVSPLLWQFAAHRWRPLQ